MWVGRFASYRYNLPSATAVVFYFSRKPSSAAVYLIALCTVIDYYFMAESDQTEAEKPTGTVRGTKEKNPESESHVNKETPAKHVMTDQERETEREKEETGTKQKRGNEIELETERSQRKVIEEVEAEIDHLTDGKVGSHDILKIAPLRSVHRIHGLDIF